MREVGRPLRRYVAAELDRMGNEYVVSWRCRRVRSAGMADGERDFGTDRRLADNHVIWPRPVC